MAEAKRQYSLGHGPTGGHVPMRAGKIFDIMDVNEVITTWLLTRAWGASAIAAATATSCSLSMMLAQVVALLLLLPSYGWRRRPFGTSGRTRPTWTRIILFVSVIKGAQAGLDDVGKGKCSQTGIPLPTDLELWMSGQATMREQLAAAFEMHVASIPLGHNSEVAPPPEFAVPIPEPPPPPPQLQPHEHWINREEPATTHISFWICAPYYESMSLDVAMSFPLTPNRVFEAIQNSAIDMPTDLLDHPVAITPQPDEAYGAVMMIPTWVRMSGKTAVVLDGRRVGSGIFAAYFEGPLTRRALLQKVGAGMDDGIAVFLFGSLQPMNDDQREQPNQGGLILFHRQGEVPEWASELSTRMDDPGRWRPEVDHPQHLPGRHIEFQGEEQTFLHQLDRTVAPDPQRMADHAFGTQQGEVWLRAPTQRPMRMYARGKRVHSIIAVLGTARYPRDSTRVVFLDTRPLGLWPQWVALAGDFMNPGAYAEGLQIPYVEGYSLIVKGGRRCRDGVRIRVLDGEVIELLLKRTEEVAPTSSSFEPDSDDDDGDSGDDNDDNDHPMPNSSDFSDPSPPAEGGPYGPPPPRPVNEDRSRSPRREEQGQGGPNEPHKEAQMAPMDDSATESGLPVGDGQLPSASAVLRLAEHLPPVQYNLTDHALELPHSVEQINRLRQPWPTDWMEVDLQHLPLHPAAKKAAQETVTAEDLLQDKTGEPIEFLLYTDGSASCQHRTSGYAVIILVQIGAAVAILGALGGRLGGNPNSYWPIEDPLALNAEQVAVAAALLWILQMHTQLTALSCTVRYDCLVAGMAAEGRWTTPNDLGARTHSLELALREMPGVKLTMEHVRAHQGDPWNECADGVAKLLANRELELMEPPGGAGQCFLRSNLQWMATELAAWRTGALPINNGRLVWEDRPFEEFSLQPNDLIPINECPESSGDEARPFQLRAATVNIQGMGGNYPYVDEQLHRLDLNLVCIQEVKGREGLCLGRNYLRLSTESDKYWGAAIWIHRVRGLMTVQGQPMHVLEQDMNILHQCPRILAVLINKNGHKILVISAHCPHAGREDDRKKFMDAIRPLFMQAKHVDLALVGIDLNGRLPTPFPPATGNLEFDEPDQGGREMANLMVDAGLWAPSTYRELHAGDPATYVHPSGAESRIDYIMQGGKGQVYRAKTHVNRGFDTGSPNLDHWMLQIELEGNMARSKGGKTLWRQKFDVDKMHTQAGKDVLVQACMKFPQPAWNVHPDRHCLLFQSYYQDVLQQHFRLPTTGRSSYIPDAAWALRDGKMAMKRATKYRFALWGELKRQAWRGLKGQSHQVLDSVAKHNLMFEMAATAIKFATARIKKLITVAKAKMLDGVVATGPQNVAAVLQRAKKAGVGGRKSRPVQRPLPQLLDPSTGERAKDQADLDKIWLNYFGQQEYGVIYSVEEFLKQSVDYGGDVAEQWMPEHLPSLQDIEQTLREIPRGKTGGIDSLPSDLFNACPRHLAGVLQPLYLKSLLCHRQPLQWRGGLLYEAYKGTGTQARVENFRSLFISSFAGKALHKALRRKVQTCVEDTLHPLHFGPRKGAPVLFPAIYVAAHVRHCKATKQCMSLLFIDCRAAYYRIVRELATGTLTNDAEIYQLFARFGLEPSDMADLMELITSGGMFRQADIPEPIHRATCDFHMATWFITKYTQGESLVEAKAGSRPGEAWADTLFAFIYARVLHRVHEHLVAEDILFQVEWDPDSGVWARPGQGTQVETWDGTWADDTAVPLRADTAEELMSKTRRLCSIMVSTLRSHGLDPNLKRNKTSLLLGLTGPGSKKVRRREFADGRPELLIEDIGESIPVVDSYKHLGGMIDANATFSQEVRLRLSLAAGAFDEGKKLLLQNQRLPIDTRGRIFDSTVAATMHNLALWIPQGTQWQKLADGYARQVRRLLGRDIKGETVFHLPTPAAHIITGCWPLELLAYRARLSLLASLAKAAPPVLWAMLQEEQTWFRQLQADLSWLIEGEEMKWPAAVAAEWPQWWNLLRHSQGRIKRSVDRRMRKDFENYKDRESADLCLWALRRSMPPEKLPDTREMAWRCRMCDKIFGKRSGLSVHFFSVHRRKAEYRKFVTGTQCLACGRQYWATARLEDHLRASHRCVQVLRARGEGQDEVVPGYGSRRRRQEVKEHFTPAPPIPQGESNQQASMEKVMNAWEDEAHRELTAALLDVTVATKERNIIEDINKVFKGHPLYPEEILHVTEQAMDEIDVIQGDPDLRQWNEDQVEAMKDALQAIRNPPATGGGNQGLGKVDTYQDFKKQVETLQWQRAAGVEQQGHETPEEVAYELGDGWEAAWRLYRGNLPAAAVAEDLLRLLPPELRQLWERLHQGALVTLRAPEAEAGDQSLSRWCSRRRRTTEEEGQTLVVSAADAEAAAASSEQAFSGRRSWSPREDQAPAAVLGAESPVDAEGEEEEETQQMGSEEGWRCCKRRRLEDAADTPEDDEELEVEEEPPADLEEEADPVNIGDQEVLETASAAAAAEVSEEPADTAEAPADFGEVAEVVDTPLAADGYEDEEMDAGLPDFALPDFSLPEEALQTMSLGMGAFSWPNAEQRYGYADVAGPTALIGKKMLPVLTWHDSEGQEQKMCESKDIIEAVESTAESTRGGRLIKRRTGRKDLKAWQTRLRRVMHGLTRPRLLQMPIKDFAREEDRKYQMDKYTAKGFSYERALADTEKLAPKVNTLLLEFEELLRSDKALNAFGHSWDDLYVLPSLRVLTCVKSLVWPTKVRAYVEQNHADAGVACYFEHAC
ncbi:grxB [Symbiodinium sp. CCMP2456]|nr:grxB [Symbiodinium sp. CCMP2456]